MKKLFIIAIATLFFGCGYVQISGHTAVKKHARTWCEVGCINAKLFLVRHCQGPKLGYFLQRLKRNCLYRCERETETIRKH